MNINLTLGLFAVVIGSAGLGLYLSHLKEGKIKHLEKAKKLELINAEINFIKFMNDFETGMFHNSQK